MADGQIEHWRREARNWAEAADREGVQELLETANCFAKISITYSNLVIAEEIKQFRELYGNSYS